MNLWRQITAWLEQPEKASGLLAVSVNALAAAERARSCSCDTVRQMRITAATTDEQPCLRRCVELPPMRCWLLALLLFVLPFQSVWASAAPYCAHEMNSSAAKHFGHHEHRHAANGEIEPALSDNGDGSGAYHADCESCHLGCSPPLSPTTHVIGRLPPGSTLAPVIPRFTSHISPGPERPDRRELSAAARFGGGVVLDLHTA